MNANQKNLLTAIIAIIDKDSVSSVAGEDAKKHNSTSAEHWLARGIHSTTIKLSIDDKDILSIDLLGVDDIVKIPLPILTNFGEDTAALSSLIASLLWLAMSKTTGQGSDRYPEFARLLAPIVAGCMSPVQQVYQHKLATGETASRVGASKNPAEYLTDYSLLASIEAEDISFSVYGGVITLIGHKRDLSAFTFDDDKELVLPHLDGSYQLEKKGVMMTIKFKPAI